MRAFVRLWDEITRERYGVTDEKLRRFRYGVQVNSLGLTEQQPENNVQRIVLEMLGVTLSKNARARAVQLPAWNEALGLPRPWDQQWSLRAQQVLAFETDLLEYDDIFEGSVGDRGQGGASSSRTPAKEMDRRPGARRRDRGGRVRLHEAAAGQLARRPPGGDRERRGHRRRREQVRDHGAVAADRGPRRRHPGRRSRGGTGRDRGPRGLAGRARPGERSTRRSRPCAAAAKTDANLMEATLVAARAGVTTGEWAGTLREVFGEYRAPTGVSGAVGVADAGQELTEVRERSGRPGGARWPAAAAGRQAGPRRPLQRRRADRRTRPRRRLRGHLRGHPADARADRRRGGRRGRALRGPLDPLRLAHGAGAGRARADEGGRDRGRPGDRRRHHPRPRRARASRSSASPRCSRPRTSA